MSAINIRSTEPLLALEARLQDGAQALEEAVVSAQAQTSAMLARLEAQRGQCRSQIAQWQSRIDDADEDEDTGAYSEQLEEWSDKLEHTLRAQARLEAAAAHAGSVLRRAQQLAQEQTPRARQFLRRRVEEIEQYQALHALGSESPSGVGAPGSAPTSTRASVLLAGVHGLGYRRAARDPRDWLWSKLFGPVPADLPERANLESCVGPADDQGETPQCVCYSLVALKHFDAWHQSGQWLRFDPAAAYAASKARDGCPDQDGTTIRDAFKIAVKEGLVASDGARHCVKGYARLESVGEICHALSLGKVVLVGLQIAATQLATLGQSAVVAAFETSDGGHCMLAVGFDSAQERLRIRNSWGRDWGDTGYCWLPFSHLSSDEDFEAWTSVDEKVEAPLEAAPEPQVGTGPPSREVFPASNFAWFDPADAILLGEDGPDLGWSGIPPEVADQTLDALTRMRSFLDMNLLKSARTLDAAREALARAVSPAGERLFSEADVEAFNLYFDSAPIRIDITSQGGFDVINGRHRLYRAQQTGVRSVPVLVSNAARKLLRERMSAGDHNQ